MFWFYVHFKVLNHSGTGDDFMSPAFQETLLGSPLTVDSEGGQCMARGTQAAQATS